MSILTARHRALQRICNLAYHVRLHARTEEEAILIEDYIQLARDGTLPAGYVHQQLARINASQQHERTEAA